MELQQLQTGRMQKIDYTLAKGHLPTNQQKHCRPTDEQKDEDGDGHHEGSVSIESDGLHDPRFENTVPPKKNKNKKQNNNHENKTQISRQQQEDRVIFTL